MTKMRKSREDTNYSTFLKSKYPFNEPASPPRSLKSSYVSAPKLIPRVSDLNFDLIEYLKTASKLESELNIAKQELCMRADYCAMDNFRRIDVSGRGYIRESDLSVFLREIDAHIRPDQVAVIFKRLDTDQDGIISYSDFLDLVVPLEPHYEHVMKGRAPKNQLYEFSFFELYTYRTRDCVKQLFQLAYDVEMQLQLLRNRLRIDRESLFELFDVRGVGRIERPQLLRYCERNGLALNSNEVELLFRKFDKNEDNVITYNDFAQEIEF